MAEPRQHPDLFTASEALAYMHLSSDANRTLETLRTDHGLTGMKFGKEMLYHKDDLDATILRKFGKGGNRQVESGPRLRIGGRTV